MKQKLLFGLCIAAVAVGMLAGCKKEEGGIVTLGVRTEGVGDAKVTLVNDKPTWKSGEEFRLNASDVSIRVDGAGNASVEAPEGETYRAIYPASILANPDADIQNTENIAVVLPRVQQYSETDGKQDIDIPMGAYTTDGSTLNFKNLCSLVEVNLTNKETFSNANVDLYLQSISIIANNALLSGTGTATINGGEGAIVLNDGSNSVSLNFDKHPCVLKYGTSKTFYLVVPPISTATNITISVKSFDADYGETYNYSKQIAGNVTLSRNYIATTFPTISNVEPLENNIPFFSVSEDKRVLFARGNLQYDQRELKFAERQYDFNPTIDANHWEYFAWGFIEVHNNQGDFVDWGTNSSLIANEGYGWRSMSADEWNYLLGNRSTSVTFSNNVSTNARYVRCCIEIGTEEYVNGLILFPDEVEIDAPEPAYINGGSYTSNTYSLTDWAKFEDAGCAFLPAAGYCDSGSNVVHVGAFGVYWTSSGPDDNPKYMYFNEFDMLRGDGSNYDRSRGASIRLIKYLRER